MTALLRFFRSSIISVILLISCQSLAQERCNDLLKNQKKSALWHIVTGRTFEDYNRMFGMLNAVFTRAQSQITQIDIDKDQSILSLGEGSSDFIATLLKNNPDGVYHAVDAQERQFDEDDPRSRETIDFYDNKKKYPMNYHLTFFQEMSLQDINGQPLLFDEIISSWALNFVLEKADPEERAKVFLNVLSHLKVGGRLRFWPPIDTLIMSEIVEYLKKNHGLVFDKQIHIMNLNLFMQIQKVDNNSYRLEY